MGLPGEGIEITIIPEPETVPEPLETPEPVKEPEKEPVPA